jgi:hypothetical protein
MPRYPTYDDHTKPRACILASVRRRGSSLLELSRPDNSR